jgi:uncharacterized protein (DUF849 family)
MEQIMDRVQDVVIITCALTGGIHGKEAHPNLPEQPDEIVAQGIAAWRAGAAILHVHARNPDGSNTMDPAIFGELHKRLCAETDAIVQLTTGGSPRLPVNERLNTILLAPEMCSLNMGLLNFFIRGEQVFFANHRADIERFAHEIRARNVKPEFEVYSSVMLEEVAHLLSLNLLEPPYAINFVLHTPTQGGQRGTPQNLLDMHARLWLWASMCASAWRTTCTTAGASRCGTTLSWSSARRASPASLAASRPLPRRPVTYSGCAGENLGDYRRNLARSRIARLRIEKIRGHVGRVGVCVEPAPGLVAKVATRHALGQDRRG